jgi:hypothetical protein
MSHRVCEDRLDGRQVLALCRRHLLSDVRCCGCCDECRFHQTERRIAIRSADGLSAGAMPFSSNPEDASAGRLAGTLASLNTTLHIVHTEVDIF